MLSGLYGRMGWFGPIFLYIILALAILGVISIFKSFSGEKSKPPAKESAMDILMKRFAKGEISREEFEEMKSNISKTGEDSA